MVEKTTKKPGRTRKSAPANAVIIKMHSEITLEHAMIRIEVLEESVKDLEQRLDLAYREQEEMLIELNKCVNATIRHCDQVQYNTGSIKLHDVEYCADMIKRILDHKFGYKPKMQEL